MDFEAIVEKLFSGNYLKFTILPAILFIVFLFLIFVMPGIPEGIDLKGGTMLVFRADVEINGGLLKTSLEQEFDLQDLEVISTNSPTGYGAIIQFSGIPVFNQAEDLLDLAQQQIKSNPEQSKQNSIKAINLVKEFYQININELPTESEQAFIFARDVVDIALQKFQGKIQLSVKKTLGLEGQEIAFQIREVGPAIGKAFWENAITVAIIGILLIIGIIFIFFRELIPSFAIIGAAVFDITTAMAMMAVFGIPLSLASIPALLMLIGYSVDTDIMLTTRMLKRKDATPVKRTIEAMKTGLTMTLTTVVALLAMLILAWLNQMLVIYEIAIVLFFGLLGDLISTWFMNAPVLLWYVDKQKQRRKH